MSDFRIDCGLGVEIKKVRFKYGHTLMFMSESLGWRPSKLSNYENNIGALTDFKDAVAIDRWCRDWGDKLPDNAIALSNKAVRTDLTKAREFIAEIHRLAGVEQ